MSILFLLFLSAFKSIYIYCVSRGFLKFHNVGIALDYKKKKKVHRRGHCKVLNFQKRSISKLLI